MGGLVINILCRNPTEDRVIARFSRHLRDGLGWILSAKPDPSADAYYLSLYFEDGLLPRNNTKPVGAYFSHREVEPPGNPKAKWFDRVAAVVDLRITTAAIYQKELASLGPTVQIPVPLERDSFTIPARKPLQGGLVAGFSGYKYGNKRKGEDLAAGLLRAMAGARIGWKASGRGWPVRTTRLPWAAMPAFYQSLDILVVPSRVEGVPMPPLEALACGVSVVIPRGVGLLDELPAANGIHRYTAGDSQALVKAFKEAIAERKRVDRSELRAATERYTVEGWCKNHQKAFEWLVIGERIEVLRTYLVGDDWDILNRIRKDWREVEAVLGWTARYIPQTKRQIAPYQGAFLAHCAHQLDSPGAQFLEIGSATGYSACLMATAAPRAIITTLNPKNGEYEKAVTNLKIRSNVKVVKQTSQQFFSGLQAEVYDLIFVDGDHSYQMVLHDSGFFNRLCPGGTILFHDYSPDGSTRPSAGCYQALNELQQRHREADIKIVGTGQVGMLGWIRKEGEVWS